MAEDRPPYHTVEDDPDLVRPRQSREKKKTGKGGSRHGYVSDNEIEDMSIFDRDPGKAPSKDEIHDWKAIDENRYRKRK